MPDQSSAATEHSIIQEITRPLETLPDDPLEIVNAEFPTALRGYDRLAVDDYVRQTRQLVAELQATRSPEAAVRRALERVGEQISGILKRAHETAEQITAQSRSEAEDRLEQARQEAHQIMAAAEERVRDLDADTDRIWLERQRIVADAEDLAAQLQAVARTAAERFPEDAEPADEAGLSAGSGLTGEAGPSEAGGPSEELAAAGPAGPDAAGIIGPDAELGQASPGAPAIGDPAIAEPADEPREAEESAGEPAAGHAAADAGGETGAGTWSWSEAEPVGAEPPGAAEPEPVVPFDGETTAETVEHPMYGVDERDDADFFAEHDVSQRAERSEVEQTMAFRPLTQHEPDGSPEPASPAREEPNGELDRPPVRDGEDPDATQIIPPSSQAANRRRDH